MGGWEERRCEGDARGENGHHTPSVSSPTTHCSAGPCRRACSTALRLWRPQPPRAARTASLAGGGGARKEVVICGSARAQKHFRLTSSRHPARARTHPLTDGPPPPGRGCRGRGVGDGPHRGLPARLPHLSCVPTSESTGPHKNKQRPICARRALLSPLTPPRHPSRCPAENGATYDFTNLGNPTAE